MHSDRSPETTSRTPAFVLHLVQLSGNPSLLGTDHLAWRLTGAGLNVVAGGNGSGKSLLCAAIWAAVFPTETVGLRHGLFAAGLRSITLVGQEGDTRKEWTLELDTGEVIHRPSSNNDEVNLRTPISRLVRLESKELSRLPHFVLNGDWTLPGRTEMDWAGKMLSIPLEWELASWEARLNSLQSGDGATTLDALGAEISKLDSQIANAQVQRDLLADAERQELQFRERIADTEMAIQISSAEETELVGKIELAERAVHLENWAAELRATWNSVEATRNQFAQLHDRLDTLQQMTRVLPENVIELAHEYSRLEHERETLALRLKEYEQNSSRLDEQKAAIQAERQKLQSGDYGDVSAKIEKLQKNVYELERELTELSRKRIDLLRRRDGIEQQRHDKYRDLSLLGPEEWAALERFMSADELAPVTSKFSEREKQQSELDRLTARLNNEFTGFDKLSANTPARIEKLFAIRESVSVREADLALLRSKVVEMQSHGTGTGLKVVLAMIGAASAGVPSGLLLGWDIGFFAAVLGGGAGFGIGHMLVPKSDVSHDELVRKIESLQTEQQESLRIREALRLELTPFAEQLQLDSALTRWQEYCRLVEHRRALEAAIEVLPVIERPNDNVPAALRKLDREDVRRRVSEYQTLTAQLIDATAELDAFDHSSGAGARKYSAEAEATQLREDIANMEELVANIKAERAQKLSALNAEMARIDQELASVQDVALARTALRQTLEKMEWLDELVNFAFTRTGPESIVRALDERNQLQNELRETKARLSTEHSPQELAVRTSLIEEELRQVSERITEIDPLFGTLGSRQDSLDKYRAQMENLFQLNSESKHLIDELTHEIINLKLPELRRTVEELPAEQVLLHNRAAAQSRLDELHRSIQTAEKMCEALVAELSDVREKASARVMSILQSQVFEAIGERFASVEHSSGTWFVVTDDGQRRPVGTLSRGVAELVTLCLNAGLLHAASEAERVPVLWDDVLSQLDDHHLSIARQVIDRLARERQVILLTRDPRIRMWGKSAEVLDGKHILDVMVN